MAVIIASARGDEHGKIKGGQAGDQTGREVCTETFYVPKAGWRVFRPKDPEVAEKMARDMQYACDNNLIGYDQSQNQTLWHAVVPLGYDCSKVKVPVETDCSQLMRVVINYAGIPIGMFSTADEPSYLLGTGAFKEMVGADYTSNGSLLKRGDVLCTKTKGHTALVMTNGSKVGKVITVDGWWGKDTTKYTAMMYGLNTNLITKQYRLNKSLCPNCTGGWEWKLIGYKGGSAVIAKMQNFLNSKGYNVGSADGIVGKKFIVGLGGFLKAQGLYSGTPKKLDAALIKAWQTYVNRYYK